MVWQAYRRVKSNQGSSGIDRMDWVYLEDHLKPELYKLWNRLTSGSYFPLPVKQVSIAKKDGGIRHLARTCRIERCRIVDGNTRKRCAFTHTKSIRACCVDRKT